MRRLLGRVAICLAFLGGSAPLEAAITLGNHGCAGSANTNDVTVTIDSTGASLVAVTVANYAIVAAPVVTDNKSGTVACVTEHASANERNLVCYITGASFGSGHAITATRTLSYPSICVAAFTNTATSAPLDQQSGGSGTSSVALGSITPTQNNEVLVSGVAFETLSSPAITGLAITDAINYSAGAYFGSAMAYTVQTTATTVTTSWTGISVTCGGTIVSFKEPGAPAGCTGPTLTLLGVGKCG